jgi:hypothetical protein
VLVPPAVKVPQLMELSGVVHALSEYTPKFADVFTAPLDDTFLDVLMAAKVVSDKANATITNAITDAVIESFSFCVFYSSYKIPCVLSLNKHYYLWMYTVHLNNTYT